MTSDGQRLHLVLERISSLFRSQLRDAAVREGLKLVQLEALIYLSVANRYSDTAGAAAEYLGVTKGTMSQTLMALENRGLISKTRDADDARITHCALTRDGEQVVQRAHPVPFIEELPQRALASADDAAIEVLRALQSAHDFRTFGQCSTCTHLQRTGNRMRCGLTTERLTKADTLRICREHAVGETQ